ncbi:MAG TPA: lysophospholipid acyltransferase family protein, partial [Steroidobacteraceae bacterium]|nr:lysophospholipid acyltransferase family protein [Steroidobacteraceae bacterium]
YEESSPSHRREVFLKGWARARALLLLPLRIAYSVWVFALALGVGLSALPVLAVLPGVTRRRAAARTLGRIFFTLAAMPVTLRFAERIPEGQCVVVCNHASYLDGIVLTAALPPRFSFVIKREMAAVPFAGWILKRLRSEFVERFDRKRGARDARRLMRTATLRGTSLVFFPEGTFTRTPGLLKFHTGAFATAARASCPLVPAVLRGTRRALPPNGALPRPGRIEMQILKPIAPLATTPQQAAPELRDRARAAMLAALGEPDLTCSADTARRPDRARARPVRASST